MPYLLTPSEMTIAWPITFLIEKYQVCLAAKDEMTLAAKQMQIRFQKSSMR